jgi:MFS family permease
MVRLGRQFGWLWAAYAVSALGTWLAFDAFPLIAVRVLHAGPAEVAALASAGLAVGAVLAIPLGPWMEFRRKRPVLIAMDVVRFGVLLTVPISYALGALSFVQLLVVSVVVGAADIAFKAASGAYLKSLVPPEGLLAANARFESTTWTTTMLGPPLGGAAIGLFGPVITVLTNAASFLLSAFGIGAITGAERAPVRTGGPKPRDLLEGWRYILSHPALRRLFINGVLVNGLIMAGSPLLIVLMVGRLGFAPWEYGLAFAVPSIGGLVGSRLSRRLVVRFGRHRVLYISGVLRSLWPIGLVFVGRGLPGLILVMAVELGLIVCCAVYAPVSATYRLQQTPADRTARVLSAWSVTGGLSTAALTALWGLLGTLTSPRIALAFAGLLLLATPVLLPRHTTDAPVPAPVLEVETAAQ